MLRFIALIGDGSETAGHAMTQLMPKLAATAGWLGIELGPRAKVFYKSERPEQGELQILPDRGGVILGRLFAKPAVEPGVCRQLQLDQRAAAAVVSSAGRALIDHYWGRYVAFLHQPASRSLYVLRDPSGHLPCFGCNWQGVSLYFSQIEDCLGLGLPAFTINWRFVAAYLCEWRLQSHETGLEQVAEVPAGECVEHRDDGSTQSLLYWSPVAISRSQPLENFAAAVDELRHATRSCIWAWASCYPRILLSLSGGLDSSIVLSCLRTAPSRPAITCVHYYHDAAADTDERRFAELAASRYGCKITERRLDATVSMELDALSGISKCPRPAVYQYSVQHAAFDNELALRSGASAVFKGIGGDQVFFQGGCTLAVSDHLHSRSLLRAWQLAQHVARAERSSVWAVLKSGWAGLLRRPWNPLQHAGSHQQLVSPQVVAAVRDDTRWIHPWLRSIDGVPAGKLQHVDAMLVPFDYYDPLRRLVAAERVHPLFSQPVMETCLRIPTYLMAAGGRDRAVARQAFAAELPQAIVSRQGKGHLNSYVQRLLQQNLPYLRAMLLDGQLIKRQLLDRQRVEAALAAPRPQLYQELAELFIYHLSTEAWIRSWSTA